MIRREFRDMLGRVVKVDDILVWRRMVTGI